VNPNKETVLEMAVQNVVNVDFTLKVVKHLRENHNQSMNQSIIYALNNDQPEIAKYLFSTLDLSSKAPKNNRKHSKNSKTENLEDCLFDDYGSFILEYEKHETHDLMKFFKNELMSKNNDDFIRKAIWKCMETKENKYGKAFYDECFLEPCCRAEKTEEIYDIVYKSDHYCLVGVDTLEKRLEILSVKRKDEIWQLLEFENKNKTEKSQVKAGEIGVALGDKCRLWSAIKHFHRNQPWNTGYRNRNTFKSNKTQGAQLTVFKELYDSKIALLYLKTTLIHLNHFLPKHGFLKERKFLNYSFHALNRTVDELGIKIEKIENFVSEVDQKYCLHGDSLRTKTPKKPGKFGLGLRVFALGLASGLVSASLLS
jgi:hypothetical protein